RMISRACSTGWGRAISEWMGPGAEAIDSRGACHASAGTVARGRSKTTGTISAASGTDAPQEPGRHVPAARVPVVQALAAQVLPAHVLAAIVLISHAPASHVLPRSHPLLAWSYPAATTSPTPDAVLRGIRWIRFGS